MSQAATKVRLEDLDIQPYMITKLKMAGIQSVFDLAISIPYHLIDIGGGILTGTDEHVALELVIRAKKALVDSGLLFKDFCTAQDILERRKNLLRCTTGSPKLDSFLKGGIETQAITETIMIDSPYHMYDQTRFSITEAGVQDVEEYKNAGPEW